MASPYAELRILAPRPVLLGTGDPNSLENILVDQYPDGAVCYVTGEADWFVLDKSSVAAVDPPTVIATGRGASAPGRWSRYVGATGTGVLNYPDNPALRAAPAPLDGQLTSTLNPLRIWKYNVALGAGMADDDLTIIKPATVLIGDPGRYSPADGRAVIGTFAEVRLAISGSCEVLDVLGKTTFGDGFQGTFDRRPAGAYLDDDTDILVAGAFVYVRRATIAALDTLYAVNWAQPAWFIDGTVGLDTNDGITALTPLQTGAELLRRLGPYAIWPQSVTVTVGVNGLLDDDAIVLRGLLQVAGTHMDVTGTPTVLATDTIGSYLARSHVTPRTTEITGTAVVDFSPYQWRRLRLTSGVNIGAVAFVATADPGGVGVATASTQPWSRINPIGTSYVTYPATPVAGDEFVVEVLPKVPELILEIDGPLAAMTVGALWPMRQCSVTNLDVSALFRRVIGDVRPYKVFFFGLRCEYTDVVQARAEAGGFTFDGCLFGHDDVLATAGAYLPSSLQYCLVGNGMKAVIINRIPANIYACLFQGVNTYIPEKGTLNDVQFFDVPITYSGVLQVNSQSITTCFSISGDRNLCPIGIRIANGVTIVRGDAVWNLKAATADIQLTNAPTQNLTAAQGFQPSDYAQHGITPAMVAGTTTVTVPWYDNTTQRVTISHAVFAGTPGILSVQQISTTQFTITSSNALDTSTVNWQISPLGKNIFISTV
jgi:hypothetical protein